MGKPRIEDFVFWAAILVLVLWIIGKIVGVIHSPVLVEMVPYLSIAFGAGAFYQKISHMTAEVEKLAEKTGKFEHAIAKINARCEERHGGRKKR